MWTAEDYGDTHADLYDELMDKYSDSDQAVQLLVAAGHQNVLEFGCGTGRLAIPLVNAGLSVTGVEISQRMLDVLAAKPESDRVRVERGDFTTVQLEERFDAVLLSRNTLLAFPEQDSQVAAVINAARHLTPAGRVYIDLGMPDLSSPSGLQLGGTIKHGTVMIQRSQNVFRQEVQLSRIIFQDGPPQILNSLSRYIWPAELDLMAKLAGLRRVDRWEDWAGTPFTPTSRSFVFAYGSQEAGGSIGDRSEV